MNRYKELTQFRKSFDIITNKFHYPIATYICTLISFTAVTPNIVTLISILLELIAIILILYDFYNFKLIIAVLLQFGYIFDLTDGMLARYKKMGSYNSVSPSFIGKYLDSVSDHVLRYIIFACLVYTYTLNNNNNFLLGLIFIVTHSILQTEHFLRELIQQREVITKSRKKIINNSNIFLRQMALFHNNIYLFYIVFIPLNRLDLFFQFYILGSIILLFKRGYNFFYVR